MQARAIGLRGDNVEKAIFGRVRERNSRQLKNPGHGVARRGKTTLTRALAPYWKAVVFNADDVRANINKDLGFSLESG